MRNPVNIKWPKGKDGPYELIDWSDRYYQVIVDGDMLEVPVSWCELAMPTMPKIEANRLYYAEDNSGEEKIRIGCSLPSRDIRSKTIRPIYCRWEDLSVEEHEVFRKQCEIVLYMSVTMKMARSLYEKAYKLVVGEEHS